jgi:hypothetical protein
MPLLNALSGAAAGRGLNPKETNRPSLIKGKAETAYGGFNQNLRRFQTQKSPAIVRFQLGISERVWWLSPTFLCSGFRV